jgi:hypothetical protein
LDAGEGFGHEARLDVLLAGDLFDHEPDGHDGVGHREGVGVAEVDLLLAGRVLVLRVLDRDAHLLEGEHGAATQVARTVGAGQVEVRPRVDRPRGSGRVDVGVGEVEVLHLGSGEEGVAVGPSTLEGPPQRVARAALERGLVEVEDVAEDPRDRLLVAVPGK